MSTISPAAGRCGTYRWKYHCVRSRSVGAGRATTLRDAGIQELRDPLDRRALARGIPALEDHDDPRMGRLHPRLHVDELRLKAPQLRLVEPLRQLSAQATSLVSTSIGSRGCLVR